jgi:RND family efflux transporter MFP subunit
VGQVVSAGQPIVRLAHDGPRDAVFAVSEQLAMGLKLGQAMQATLLSTGQILNGKVRELAASADPVTRTFAVRAALSKPQIALGSTATVLLNNPSATSKAISLPTTALRQEGGQTMVWVLDPASMTLRAQVIEIATLQGNDVVVKSGLQVGQQVVAAGVHVLSPGQKVSIYQVPGAKP